MGCMYLSAEGFCQMCCSENIPEGCDPLVYSEDTDEYECSMSEDSEPKCDFFEEEGYED